MGTILIIIGAIWGMFGVFNLLMTESIGKSSNLMAFAVMGNMLIYVLPGLVLIGIGYLCDKSKESLDANSSPQKGAFAHHRQIEKAALTQHWDK